MDGWEICRCRLDGFDWCIVCLGIVGCICVIDVNMIFFKGNVSDVMLIEVCYVFDDFVFLNVDQWEWFMLIELKKIKFYSYNLFELIDSCFWIYLCLNIFLDGGVVCLCVYGEFCVDWSKLLFNELVDLVVCVNGGWVLVCFDMFFSLMNNLIVFNCGKNMGDGWEI